MSTSKPLPVKGKFERGMGALAVVLLLFATISVGYWNVHGQLLTIPLPTEKREVTVSAYMWGFYPNVVKMKQGEKIALKITSLDVVHGIGSDHKHWGIETMLKPGKTMVVEFEPEHPGEYKVYCTAYCGAKHSEMVATLLVT